MFPSLRAKLRRFLVRVFTFAALLSSTVWAQTDYPGANAASSGLATSAIPPSPTLTERPKQFVLTRIGAIYEGVLVDKGESFSVEFEGGGSASISKLDALFIGDSREAVYRYKMSQTPMEDVNEVLRLADWASRRQLAAEAIDTLEAKLVASNDDAERRALKKKLDQLKQAEAIRVDVARAVAERERTKETENSDVANKKEVDPRLVELEEWAKGIPYAAFDKFNRKAHPTLQKRCGVGGCHAEGDPSQYIVQPKGIGASARFALLSNIRATLDYVDFDNIDGSPILNHPTVTNEKGERVYPFGNDRSSLKDCQNFVEWINSLKKEQALAKRVRETRRSPEKKSVPRPGAASRYDLVAATATNEQTPEQGAIERPEESFSGLFEDDGTQTRPASASDDVIKIGVPREAEQFMPKEEDDVNSTTSILKRVGAAPQKEYRDEYDPEIFNDRYQLNKGAEK